LKGNEVNYLRIDLKICEGCGVLWLRRVMVDGVYCRECAGRLAEFPAPRAKHAGGRRQHRVRAAGCSSAAKVAGGAR
jgi:Zn-finger nucleic acid-binding protein